MKRKIFKTEEDWLSFKQGKVGGSIIGVIDGVNPYSSPYELWERFTKRIPEIETSLQMKVGMAFEEGVLKLAQMDYDIKSLRNRDEILLFEDEDNPMFIDSPDDVVVYQGKEMLCEIKTTKLGYTADEIPLYNQHQMNWACGIGGYDTCLFLSFQFYKGDYIITTYDFDTELYAEQRKKAAEFLMSVETDNPPSLTTHSDFDKQETDSTSIVASKDIIDSYMVLCQLNDVASKTKKMMDDEKLSVKKFIGFSDTIKSEDGVVLATYKPTKKGNKSLLIKYNNVEKL